jgi:transcriptional regulator with XRE-family HTH domain
MKINNTFGDKLNTLKTARGLTSAELAHRAGIGEGLLSGLIHGQRVIGECTARKIGRALQLHGEELEDFVYAAINNCSEKTLASSKRYPAELINLVAGILQESGILPDTIIRCARKEKDADAALYLKNGGKALIRLELAFA